MEGMPDDMWSPYKNLYRIIEYTLANPTEASIGVLENTLKKHKQTFSCLLKNSPKNERSRELISNYNSQSLPISANNRTTIISEHLIYECNTISDMFNLDELLALELLCTAHNQSHYHPGVPRGLVAILLYYDGRKAIATSLRDLFQVTSGVSWTSELPKELVRIISTFTQSIVDSSNVLERILDLLELELDITNEIVLLTKNRALGSNKHQNQVMELFEEIRLALATALFHWSAQRSLPSFIVTRLIKWLSNYKSTLASGSVDDITLTLLMALLYSYDTSVLQKQEDNHLINNINIIKDKEFAQVVLQTLIHEIQDAQNKGITSLLKYSFGLSLAGLRHAMQYLDNSAYKVVSYDDRLVGEAINAELFKYMYHFLLDRELLYSNEFFCRRFHALFTDFIDFMHSKVTELRGKADETSKTVLNFTSAGLEPPTNLDRNFELLLLCIGKFYKDNRSGLSLCMEYWGSFEPSLVNIKATNRSVSLFKFIRLAGELLPTTLFVSYLKMIAGLSCCEKSARNTFNLLKQANGLNGSSTLSWEHFFASLNRYYTNLRQEIYPSSDPSYRHRSVTRPINPNEIEGLSAVLEVIQSVAEYDEMARIAICEHPNWNALCTLLGLLSCSVPLSLKADILAALAALGKSKETSFVLWNNLEASQIINTIPNTNVYSTCNLAIEIEQNECRIEKYPLTKSVLDLMYSLVLAGVPKNLGCGPRKPGLNPYLQFIINEIFVKFYSRNYKDPVEKWTIGTKCLKIFYYLLNTYEVSPQDFNEQQNSDAPPGFYIMLQLQNKTTSLQLMLSIIDECHLHFMDYKNFYGKQDLGECTLYCLRILRYALMHQEVFFDAHSMASSSLLLCGLKKILLDVNPRTKLPDYILNTTSFIIYSNWLPNHALESVRILQIMLKQISISIQIIEIFLQDESTRNKLRQGFIESLEYDYIPMAKKKQPTNVKNVLDELECTSVELQTKEVIIQLIKDNLYYPIPNFSFFLLGVECNRDNMQANQSKCAIDWKSNCTKSIISLLDNHLEMKKTMADVDIHMERIVEKLLSLLYLLCSNMKTSDSILRYLRSRNDFICRHLKAYTTMKVENSTIINQMSYLLKCAAIELKAAASSNQLSRFGHILKFFICDTNEGNDELPPLELDLSNFYQHSNKIIIDAPGIQASPKESNLLLCDFLNYIDFEMNASKIPAWNFFDNVHLREVLHECEVKSFDDCKIVDIKKLHSILHNELKAVQTSIATGQRKLIMEEMESVLLYAIRVNEEARKNHAKIRFMESWGQLTEILFSCARGMCLSPAVEQVLIMEILQKIITKVTLNPLLPEEGVLLSGTVLLLLVNLRNCLSKTRRFDFPINDITELEDHGSVSDVKSNTLNLKHILKNIIEWIISSGVSSQKLRINLYASLLNCLNILKDQNFYSSTSNEINKNNFIMRLDKSSDNNPLQIQILIKILTLFGDKLMELICHDCIAGHDVCKILAFACINIFIEVDVPSTFMTFIDNRGYLTDIVESLIKSNENLCNVLNNTPDNMKCLYVYESKMSMLLCMANSCVGAEILLSNRILEILSCMSVFNMHPDLQKSEFYYGNETNSFIYSVDARFRQILFPALHLCDCLLTTLGPENYSVVTQVVHFLLSHFSMVEMVLRAANPFSHLGLLQEVSLITGLISRTFIHNIMNMATPEFRGDLGINMFKVQTLMLSILSRFIINDDTFKDMLRSKNVLYEPTEENIALHKKHCLEISANAVLYCRNMLMDHSVDHRSNRLLFAPNINDMTKSSKENKNTALQQHFNLDILIKHLRGVVENYYVEKAVVKNLNQQKSCINDIAPDASAQEKYLCVTKETETNENNLSLCVFIIQHLMYLLWAHLDVYMKIFAYDNFGNPSHGMICLTEPTKKVKVTVGDMLSIKKTLISVFNETFSKQLCFISENLGAPHDNAFNGALLRRIQSLIQSAPVD